MAENTRAMRVGSVVLGSCLAIGLAGCDYWPPALQAQIEQMRSETQTLTMEKTQLQGQVNELAKTKQDMQAQIDELSRANREKTAMIASLHNQVEALRVKLAKAATPPKPATKATMKAAPKPAVKKQASTKR